MPTNKELWTDTNTFATTLFLLFIDKFGLDPLAGEDPWDPETVQMEINEEFGITVPDCNLSKLLALALHLSSDRFYKRLADFIRICNVLSGATAPDPDDPADVDEIVWAMTEAMLVEPPDEPEPFTQEIRRYIGEKLKDEGFLDPPDLLRIGIRTDNWRQSLAEFSDRPDLLHKIKAAADAKNAEIMQMLKGRLSALLEQLGALRLESGDTTQLVQKVVANLQTTTTQT